MVSVYSIWLCFDMEENCMNHFYVEDKILVGKHVWAGKRDIFNYMMIGISTDDIEKLQYGNSGSKLRHLLGILFSSQLDGKQKVEMLQKDFQINVNDDVKREMKNMCNLSSRIEEKGKREGRMQTIAEFLNNGGSEEDATRIWNVSSEDIKSIKKSYEFVCV